MSPVTALIYVLLLRLVTAVQLQGFYFHLEEGGEEGGCERGRESEGKKNNTGNVTVMQLASASVDFLLPL